MDIQVRDSGDLRRLSRAFRRLENGRELRLALTRGLRDVLRPVFAEVRASYSGGNHLRPLLRRATRMEVVTAGKSAGARIRVDGRRMPSGMGRIPQYREGERRPWRHPVYNNREVWVDQKAHPQFYRIVEGHNTAAQRQVERTVDTVNRKMGAT